MQTTGLNTKSPIAAPLIIRAVSVMTGVITAGRDLCAHPFAAVRLLCTGMFAGIKEYPATATI